MVTVDTTHHLVPVPLNHHWNGVAFRPLLSLVFPSRIPLSFAPTGLTDHIGHHATTSASSVPPDKESK